MRKVLGLVAVAVAMSGCADSHQLIRSDSATLKLAQADTLFISVPSDGAYGSDTYKGSGQNTAQIIFSAFAKRTRGAKVGRSAQDFDTALAAARNAQCTYLVFPTILHWEDRATEWSSIPDKVEVKLEVISTDTENTVTSAVIKGKSGLATFGGDHPQDLLPEPVEKFVSSFY